MQTRRSPLILKKFEKYVYKQAHRIIIAFCKIQLSEHIPFALIIKRSSDRDYVSTLFKAVGTLKKLQNRWHEPKWPTKRIKDTCLRSVRGFKYFQQILQMFQVCVSCNPSFTKKITDKRHIFFVSYNAHLWILIFLPIVWLL